MEITHDILFERIRENPIVHLGGYLPAYLSPYFMGYGFARAFHRLPPVRGGLSYRSFLEWSRDRITGAPQGLAAYCRLLTDSDEDALELFWAFRSQCLSDAGRKEVLEEVVDKDESAEELHSMTELVLGVMRERPALYFGRSCVRSLWATWSGWVWAERDHGISGSVDERNFIAFQTWIDQKYGFTTRPNWGKVMDYLGMGNNETSYSKFYDHFETFLSGVAPDEPTLECKQWIDTVVANVREQQAKSDE